MSYPMWRLHRKLLQADEPREFIDSVLYRTPVMLRKLRAKKKQVVVDEIRELAIADLTDQSAIGRVFAHYFSKVDARDRYIQLEYVGQLKSAAEHDVKTLELLSYAGIDDLEAFFYREKYPMPASEVVSEPKSEPKVVQLQFFRE